MLTTCCPAEGETARVQRQTSSPCCEQVSCSFHCISFCGVNSVCGITRVISMWLLLCHELIGSMVVWLDLRWRCAVTNDVVVVVSPIDWLYGSLVGS